MAYRIYLVYKITNRFDGKIYVGCHSTLNKDDRYMGSGIEIKEALKKYGRKSFVKEILFEYDTKEEMLSKEKEIVTREFCMREDTYNRIEGGGVYTCEGMVSVKDNEGNHLKVYRDDPRYLSGELVHNSTGNKLSEEHLLAINKSRIGTTHKEESKKKTSDKLKARYAAGEKIGGIGSKRSEEFKQVYRERNNKLVEEGKDPRAKQIKQLDLDGNLIKIWGSISQLEKLGKKRAGLMKAARTGSISYGCKWELL